MSKDTADSSNVAAAEGPVELNEKNIKKAQPGDVLRDAKITGLHLRCFPEHKVFYLYYRTKAGTRRCPKLDTYGKITLEQARKAAGEILEKVAAGRDPGAELETEKNAPTMDRLWTRYREDRGEKKKTEHEDARIWNKYLAKWHTVTLKDGTKGGRDWKVAEVTYEEVAKEFKRITSEHGDYMANRAMALLSTVMGFAIAPLRWLEINPVEGLEMNPEKKRKRYMKLHEAVAIGQQLHAEAEANPASAAFIWLLILSGGRKGEIGKAKWNQLVGNRLVLDEHKTDQDGEDRIIYLGPEAMEVLGRLPRTFGTITGILDPKKLWNKMRIVAGCPDLRMHDLRHSFASEALSLGYNLAQTGELLGHASEQTTKRYAHLLEEMGASASAKIGDSIMAKMRPA